MAERTETGISGGCSQCHFLHGNAGLIHLVCPRPTSTPLSTSPAFLQKVAFAMPYFENAGVA